MADGDEQMETTQDHEGEESDEVCWCALNEIPNEFSLLPVW